MEPITGKTLIAWGFTPGRWFGKAIDMANNLRKHGYSDGTIVQILTDEQPAPPVKPSTQPKGHSLFLDVNNDDEAANVRAVRTTMNEVMRTPHVEEGAVMPDACPAGPVGNIPVGGIVASPNIHPNMHSADVCCSVACTVINNTPRRVLDRAWQVTHFGKGPRNKKPAPHFLWADDQLAREFMENPFLEKLAGDAQNYLATQGDGNHFLFVGRNTAGQTCLVTHHGSRKPGAELYKRGMRIAEAYRTKRAPNIAKTNAWIPADTDDAIQYWAALQTIRKWTRANHFAIHDMVTGRTNPIDRFWNEHNFVFEHDGLYYHAKGATPMWSPYQMAPGDPLVDNRRLIPLNMAEPVLITQSCPGPDDSLGFAPHGAGRNFSRTEHRKRALGNVETETAGIDMRWYSGTPDTGELPSAYKSAETMRRQIENMDLATIVDEIHPYGCIMAGQ